MISGDELLAHISNRKYSNDPTRASFSGKATADKQNVPSLNFFKEIVRVSTELEYLLSSWTGNNSTDLKPITI